MRKWEERRKGEWILTKWSENIEWGMLEKIERESGATLDWEGTMQMWDRK